MKASMTLKTNKLTRASILSALLIVMEMLFLSTGMGYSFFIELVVPVFMVIMYLSCDAQYTFIGSLVSLFFTAFILGHLAGAVMMSQSILMGLMCGYVLNKAYDVLEDLIGLSIGGCLMMLLIDYYFKGLLGFSLLDEVPELMTMTFLTAEAKETIFYLSVAAVPVGSMLMVYAVGLYLAGRLHLLKGKAGEKYKLLKQPRAFVMALKIRPKMGLLSIGMLLAFIFLLRWPLTTYVRAFCVCSEYILLYFMLTYAYHSVIQLCYLKTGKRLVCLVVQLCSLLGLIYAFKVTSACLLGGYLVGCHYDRKERSR